MIVNEENFYIIKQSNGTLWNFFYDKNMRIVCKVLIENHWSSYLVTNEYCNNFYVTLLSNDNICLFYKDFIGNIIVKIYDKLKWKDEKIIQSFNKDIFEVNFKGIAIKDKIHVLYSVLNKTNNTITIFHQKIKENLQLSNAKIVDIVNSKENISFKLQASEDGTLYIMYERKMDNYEIGYRVVNEENERWSNFHIIDRSKCSYVDYSFIPFNDLLHVLAVKREENVNSVVYFRGELSIFNYDEIFRDKNISSCSLWISHNSPLPSWIKDNNIYFNFFLDNKTIPPYNKFLTSPSITKAIYASNIENKDLLIYSEIYLNDEYNYSPILNESFLIYSSSIVREKDKLINKLMHDNSSHVSKLNSIRDEFKKFKENKKLLNESIIFLQKSLVDKDQEIKKLQEQLDALNSPLKRFFNNLK